MCFQNLHGLSFMNFMNEGSVINGILIRPIKFVLDLLLPVLTHIFNLSFSTGVFPEKMQHAKIVVLSKSGKKRAIKLPFNFGAACYIERIRKNYF